MPSPRSFVSVSFRLQILVGALVLGALGVSCASGDFDGGASGDSGVSASADAGQDARLRDTSIQDTRPGDTRPTGDTHTDDTRPPRDGDDEDATVDPPDVDPPDVDPPDVDPQDADPPEDTEQAGECGGMDCAEGTVCDPATDTCVECLSDSDCPGETHCHDRAPVCVPACCNTQPSEASLALADNPYGGFDLAIDSTGTPQVAFYNEETNKLLFTTLLSGNWLRSEEVAELDISGSSSLNVRMAVGPDDAPHILVSMPNSVTHYWRTPQNPSVWNSEEVATTNATYYHVAIAFDASGGLHMAATQFKAPIIYIYKSAAGQLSEPDVRDFAGVDQENTESIALAVTRDDRPIIATKYRKNIGQPDEEHRFRVYEKLADSTWDRELVGEDIATDFGLGLSADDAPILAFSHRDRDGVHLLERNAGTWDDQRIIADADQGRSLAMATDSLGDPHLVYRGVKNDGFVLYYARWDGVAYGYQQIDNLTAGEPEYSYHPRVAVDADRGTHVLAYDAHDHVITYRHLD